MVEGFLIDHAHAATLAAKWIEGRPERSLWGNLKVRGRKNLTTSAFRCDRCGLFRLYAPTA
jgi:hypothetical protein